MGLSEQIRQELIQSFVVEQQEHVQALTQGLLVLEKNPHDSERQAVLEGIFREAHSLKGSARAVGMTIMATLGHRMEELLSRVKQGRLTLSPDLFDLLYKTLDAITLLTQQVQQNNVSAPPEVMLLLTQLDQMVMVEQESAPGDTVNRETAVSSFATLLETAVTDLATHAAPADETIRVSVSKLDALMAQFSELLAAKIQLEQRLADIREVQILATGWKKEWSNLHTQYNTLLRNEQNSFSKEVSALLGFATRNQEHMRDLLLQTNALVRHFDNDNMHLQLIIDEFQEDIKRVRMLPLSTVTVAFGRMVRDLAREQGKEIALTIIGDTTELDKLVLEQVKAPLIHLLRNAVDHGVEMPAARQQAGKPTTGQITLLAAQQGSNIVIEVQDDGQGLHLESIRETAVSRGFLSAADADRLPDSEIANLIFRSGLSTSKIITDISGRGVGLDVVRQNIEELHGILQVDFIPGQGTRFTMTLPLTLASSRGLLVTAGGQTFAMPLSTVERMLVVPKETVASIEGRAAITYAGKPVMLAWLEDLLELPTSGKDTDTITIVIVAVAEKQLGIVVDELRGEQEIVVKSLGKQLLKVGGIAGATLLGSGEVLLVLHTADLVKLAARAHIHTERRRQPEAALVAEQPTQKTILVVDDSITTRTLEKNILEAAGYKVRLATNGQEALGMLVSDGVPNLIVTDINMPYLDGFEMTNRVKQDMRYRRVPVILVTSLDSPADKAKGIAVGADAYIVKSRFDQGNLLETIEQLI